LNNKNNKPASWVYVFIAVLVVAAVAAGAYLFHRQTLQREVDAMAERVEAIRQLALSAGSRTGSLESFQQGESVYTRAQSEHTRGRRRGTFYPLFRLRYSQ